MLNKTRYRSADGGANGGAGGGNTGGAPAPDNVSPADDASKQQNPTQTETEIKDPLAFYKAQAEKNDRLREKAQAEATEAKKLAEALQNTVIKELTTKYDALMAEFEILRQQATQATTEALRARIAGEFKLGGEAVAFLTASDEATLRQQAEALSKLTGAKGGTPPPTGNVGNPAGNGGLTLETVSKMTSQDVRRQWDDILKSMKK